MSKTCEIVFSVSGWVEQTIEILDEKYTAAKIVKGLESGSICTSIQEGGEVILIDKKGNTRIIGKVIDVDNNCEYMDFTKPFEAKAGV